MTISKADAMQLVNDIRRAKVYGHCIAERLNSGAAGRAYGFLGGLESVLQDFLRKHGCSAAAAALPHAMNNLPTADEIAARHASIAAMSAQRNAA
jgi:hypothetical protein